MSSDQQSQCQQNAPWISFFPLRHRSRFPRRCPFVEFSLHVTKLPTAPGHSEEEGSGRFGTINFISPPTGRGDSLRPWRPACKVGGKWKRLLRAKVVRHAAGTWGEVKPSKLNTNKYYKIAIADFHRPAVFSRGLCTSSPHTHSLGGSTDLWFTAVPFFFTKPPAQPHHRDHLQHCVKCFILH